MALELNESNFTEMIKEDISVVDFWAPWCGPCKKMIPIIDKLAENHPELKVGKVNVDESPDIAKKYNIMSIPTIIIFKDGEPAEQTVGVVSENQILEKVNSLK